MTLWKVHCGEDRFPGMWQRWFHSEAVGVDWAPGDGFHLHGTKEGGQKGWVRARNALMSVHEGDSIVVSLRQHRVARLGEVVRKLIADEQWKPLFEPGPDYPFGIMGRRLEVRWDILTGPSDPERVVLLPPDVRFSGELRPTICPVRSVSLQDLRAAMNDERNWVGL